MSNAHSAEGAARVSVLSSASAYSVLSGFRSRARSAQARHTRVTLASVSPVSAGSKAAQPQAMSPCCVSMRTKTAAACSTVSSPWYAVRKGSRNGISTGMTSTCVICMAITSLKNNMDIQDVDDEFLAWAGHPVYGHVYRLCTLRLNFQDSVYISFDLPFGTDGVLAQFVAGRGVGVRVVFLVGEGDDAAFGTLAFALVVG